MDLTQEQMQLLGLLLEKDAFFMHEISNELMVDNSAITRLVDALEKKGFVSRKVSKQDRRLRVIAITESGKKEICKAKELTEIHKEVLIKGIESSEQEQFMNTLRKMKSNMEQSYK
ncbi:MarR family winged helix-turn-helix transcriptional regulator [Balneicella halophila]|uniref:MarR family winged helix-turn-helix transcriptional regulator n=1 Tax=Balneicella halophila TaxID=1537566 RepID=UPI001402F7B7|nr:MarR family transcriptional regulator [Balneicella halophila]